MIGAIVEKNGIYYRVEMTHHNGTILEVVRVRKSDFRTDRRQTQLVNRFGIEDCKVVKEKGE